MGKKMPRSEARVTKLALGLRLLTVRATTHAAALVVIAAGCGASALSQAALSWDGSYYLFSTVDTGELFIPYARYPNALSEGLALAVSRLTGSLAATVACYCALQALAPFVALMLSAWALRDASPRVQWWPFWGIGLITLPGQFFLASEALAASQFCWVLWSLCLGCDPARSDSAPSDPAQAEAKVPSKSALEETKPRRPFASAWARKRVALGGVIALWVWWLHPAAAPLLVGVGGLGLCRFGLGSSCGALCSLLVAAGIGRYLALRAGLGAEGYNLEQVSAEMFFRAFEASLWGWPLAALSFGGFAALCAWLAMARSATASRTTTDGTVEGTTERTVASATPHCGLRRGLGWLALGGLCLAYASLLLWAADPAKWSLAYEYRRVAPWVTLLAMAVASLAQTGRARVPLARRGPAESAEARPDEAAAARLSQRLAIACALGFALVAAAQGAGFAGLRRDLREHLEASPRCQELGQLRASLSSGSMLDHWSTVFLALLVQGRQPSALVVHEPSCHEVALRRAMLLASWQVRSCDGGWFRLPCPSSPSDWSR